MSLEYKDVSLSALTLNIVEGDFKKDNLLIIKKENVKIDLFDIEIAIIGYSHYITIKKENKVIFSEIFACVDIYNAKKYKTKEIDRVTNKTLGYTFTAAIYNINKGRDIIKSYKEKNTLIYEFGKRNEMKESAITGLRLNRRGTSLFLDTIHVYPNEERFITTHSYFDLKGK